MATVPEASDTIPPVGLDAVASRLNAHVALVATYVALCALSLLPFVLIEHPPIVDFANHAARLSLACSAGDPAVDAMYRYSLGLIPNLAADLVNWPLCGLMGPAAVLKATIAGSLALTYFSGWLLQRKLFGRINAFLLLLPAFAMNLVTTMGYINFLAGVGVACLMVALAIGRERRFGELLAIGNIGGLILFFCHIFALALAVVLFFGILFRDMPRNAKGLVQAGLKTLALFAVPLMLIPFVPSADEALKIDYIGKGRAVAALFLTQHPNPTIFGMLLFIPLYLVMRKGWVDVHQAMRWPLGVLAAYVLVVPSGLQDAIDIDARTMIALAYLFFASLRPIASGPRDHGCRWGGFGHARRLRPGHDGAGLAAVQPGGVRATQVDAGASGEGARLFGNGEGGDDQHGPAECLRAPNQLRDARPAGLQPARVHGDRHAAAEANAGVRAL